MNEQEILAGNKLIAEFMQVTTFSDEEFIKELREMRENGVFFTPKGLCYSELIYHESWDWLMPVVDKIESHGFATEICYYHAISNYGTYSCKIEEKNEAIRSYEDRDEAMVFVLTADKKESTYKAVIEFIKWYNNQQLSDEKTTQPSC